jgi:deoxyribodipyrimidine photo-lyase
VAWREWPQTGVLRHPPSPDGWALQWLARMNAVPVPMPIAFRSAPGLAPDALPALDSLCRGGAPRPLPGAGEAAAWELLRSFLDRSPRGDRRAPSIPATPQAGSSRLSAALAFGTISMRSVHQATERAIAATADRLLAHSLRAFGGRLRWHCHFLQQLEDEPAIEWRNVASAWDGVRAGDGSALGPHELECFEAWCEGRTGFPMVDAGMRSLRATGWLNFRMRALLVNVASHLLGLHWRETGLFLARQSLDFEPGIHWGQMQLQSGTTGTGLLRIDSPSKQAREHDPDGDFVRRWVPELGTPGYSVPIVDERAALAAAKARVIALHATPQVCAEAGGDPVPRRHGPGPSGLPPTGRRRRAAHRTPPATPQRDLFGDPSED